MRGDNKVVSSDGSPETSLSVATELLTSDTQKAPPVARGGANDMARLDMSKLSEGDLCETICACDRKVTLLANTARVTAKVTLKMAIRAGHALIEAKRRLAHGQWGPWLKANISGIPSSRVCRYMKLAKRISHVQKMDDLQTIRQAYLATGIIKEPEAQGGKSGNFQPVERLLSRACAARKSLRLFVQKMQPAEMTPEIKSRVRLELQELEALLRLIDKVPTHE